MTNSFRIVGGGPQKVIVLHGWFGDHGIWSPVFALLARDRFTYAFMDDRGYGASSNLEGRYTIEEVAQDALDVADYLGWARFSVVGHSMGGMAAQRLALDASARVEAVVGVTPVPASGVRLPPDIRTVFDAAADQDQAALAVIEGSMGHRHSAALARHILKLQRRTATREAFRGYLRSFADSDFSNEAAALRCPLLVIAGEHDKGITKEMLSTEFPRLYSQAKVVEVAGAGHYPMLETPPHLVTVIEDFLRKSTA